MKEKKKSNYTGSNIRKGFNNINSPFSYARSACARKESLVGILKAKFYEPSILSDIDAAVEDAMNVLGCSEGYREYWKDLCLSLGLNTFIDLTDKIKSKKNQESVMNPPGLFCRDAVLLANERIRPLLNILNI